MIPALELSAAVGLVASLLGWVLRRPRRRVSFYDETPIGLSEAQYARQKRRRRLYRKAAWATIDALAGATFGWLLTNLILQRILG
jgi:hypothetical protein